MSHFDVILPSMGEGVNEATIVKWLKKEGDPVSKDEPLVEVATDKVDTEIPAPESGFLTSLVASEGSVVTVDSTLCTIGQSKDSTARQSAKPTTPSGAPAPTAPKNPYSRSVSVSKETERPRSSPLVRKMAKERGIDLSGVPGSGQAGRITKQDILNFVAQGQATSQQTTSSIDKAVSPSTRGTDQEDRSLKTVIKGDKEYLEGVEVKREGMTRMRQLIADHMVRSVRTSPHVTTVFEVDLHQVVKIREQERKSFQDREGFKLTYTPFLIHATVEALKEHPIVNSSVDGYDILFKKDINVGVAVAIESGLIVPVIKKAGDLSLLGIARRMQDLVVRARNKSLLPEEITGGTFSITNPGSFGSITSNPIINQPQSAILGIGAIVKRPTVVDDMIAIRPQMMISLTFDHRVIDGEGGAKFLATLKGILENYSALPR